MSTDLSKTIIAKSDQLNSDDLIGGPITVTVTKVSLMGGDQPVAINYDGDQGKPYMPSKGMRRVLVAIWGSDGNAYVGRTLTLFREPSVTWAGKEVGGIRISHMSHMTAPVTMAMTLSKANKKPITIKPLKGDTAPAVIVEPTDEEYLTLKAAGQSEADKGSVAYIRWKDALTTEQKERIKPLHSGFAKTAKAFDDSQPKEEGPGL